MVNLKLNSKYLSSIIGLRALSHRHGPSRDAHGFRGPANHDSIHVFAYYCIITLATIFFAPGNYAHAKEIELLDIKVKPTIQTGTLENGLRVAVVSDHRAPTATQMLWYNVGSADDPAGKSGISHFLEHLMFKGTDTIASGDFSKIVASWGGQDNAFTSYDYTAYHQRVPRARLGDVMRLEADRMTNLRLRANDVTTEREVVLEERSQRTDNSPDGILQEQMFASLFLEHPYARPVIGWKHEIENLQRKDATSYYRRWYAPENAVLVLAGDVEFSDGMQLAQKHYGAISPPKTRRQTTSTRTSEPEHVAARTVNVTDERVGQPFLVRYYLVNAKSVESEKLASLGVFARVLGGGSTSWLYRNMVKEREVALSAGAGAWTSGRDYSILTVYAVPVDGTSLEELEKYLDEELARFIKEGLLQDEVLREKNVMLADFVYALDSSVGLAHAVGEALTNGLTVDSVIEWPQVVRSVSTDNLRSFAPDWLSRKFSVTGYLKAPDDENKDDTPQDSGIAN